MEEEKKENNEKYWDRALDAVLKPGRGAGDQVFVAALLAKRVAKLTDSIKESSKSSNKLTEKIKTLTWVIIVISLLALAILGYATFCK